MGELIFIRFLISSILVSIILGLLLGVKKRVVKHITTATHYYMGWIIVVVLLLPFVPQNVLAKFNLNAFNIVNITQYFQETHRNTVEDEAIEIGVGVDGADIVTEVERLPLDIINVGLAMIWLSGAVGVASMQIKCQRELWRIKKSIQPIEDEQLQKRFLEYKKKLKIKEHLGIGQSELVHSPMAMGIAPTYIVLPREVLDYLSEEEIDYILLHELMHCKQKDLVTNYIMVLLSIIYWFNPLIEIAFEKIRLDREIMCDYKVLRGMNRVQRLNYGKTIIHFVQLMQMNQQGRLSASMGGSTAQVKRRIQEIADFKPITWRRRVKSSLLLGMILSILLSQASTISVVAHERVSDALKDSVVHYKDLSRYFEGMEGTFVMYDLTKDCYTIYNQKLSERRVSPNSTYKIYSGLMALEEGIIAPSQSQLAWNGTVHKYKEWNQNHNLQSALSDSVTWYFQELDQQLGKKKIKKYLQQLDYGNQNLIGSIEDYWIESSLKVSAIEQVQVLTNFYLNNFGFAQENIEIIKQSLIEVHTGETSLSGKTGTGMVNGQLVGGTYVGYVEQGEDVFVFATYVDDQTATGSIAKAVTKRILEEIIYQ